MAAAFLAAPLTGPASGARGINSFAATPRRVMPGGTATLAWNASVPASSRMWISPDIGEVTALTTNGMGSIRVSPSDTTHYSLTISNAAANLAADTRLVVGPPVPNLVVFLVDDMGWQDTSVPFHTTNTLLNARFRTPAMERLAQHGIRFTSAYACAVCTPSRISLNTGFNAARHKVTNWTATTANTESSGQTSTLGAPAEWRCNGLQPPGTTYGRSFTNRNTLPRLLSEAGYRTIHCGKAHFAPAPTPGSNPLELGFDINIAGCELGHPASYYGTNDFGRGDHHVPGLDQYHGTNIFLTEALTREAKETLRQAVADRQPFYLYLAHYAVHMPIQADPRFSANYPALDGTERAYATLVEGMDKSLDDILNTLEELGVAQDTLVVFYSDNGGLSAGGRGSTPYGGLNTQNCPLRAGKGSCYEGGIRVPAIFAWAHPDPTNALQRACPIVANSACHRPILIEDLFPTLLHWAGVTPPPGIDGVDIAGYVTARAGFHRPEQFLWHYPHVWSAGYLAQNQGYEPHSVWRDGDWKVIYFYDPARWELYNLAHDVAETTNLAAAEPERLTSLAAALTRQLAARGALYPVRLSSRASVPPTLPNSAH
jgi:arylsulfatase A-like enzyme